MHVEDLVPEDCITLFEALERYYNWRWPEAPKLGEQPSTAEGWVALDASDEESENRIKEAEAQLLAALQAGELEALVKTPKSAACDRMLSDDWRMNFFLSWPLFGGPIDAFNDSPCAKYNGRTPFIRRSQFENWFKKQKSTTSKKRGRPTEYDWEGCKAKIFELLDHHGMPSRVDPVWRTKAHVEREASKWFQAKYDTEPASSTLRDRISRWLVEYETKFAGN